jgi:Integrase zinc binding domain
MIKYNVSPDETDTYWKDSTLVVMKDNDLKRGVLTQFHDSKTLGHPRISKTIALIQPHYWWPNMKTFVKAYVKGCAMCQMNKINTHPMKLPIFPITPAHSLPFQTIALDFIIKLPPSEGYDTILTITNHDISKASIFIPCKESIDAVGVAKLYATHMFPHYGLPL